ncbi:MAG: glycoside hydrolase family 3 C-terminal domain-containing protein [Clostridia bacterium]|nr:glycoside hydrolase family 3 C-terminal domain-containing protein [Clostridia bacterium]
MIKNREIINSIPTDKKLEMLADGNLLGSGELGGGVPRVVPEQAEGINAADGQIYPAYSFLVSSWNNELISSVSGDLAVRAKERGVNLLFTPEAKTKSNPYTSGLTEDPFYAGAVIYGAVKSVKNAGVTPCVTGCALYDSDVNYLDVFPDGRAVRDYIFGFAELFEGSYGGVFMTAYTKLSGKYERVNCDTVSAILRGAAGDSGFILCSQTDKDLAVESVAAGNTFSYASDAAALKTATEAYEEIKNACDRGEASQGELEAACRAGSALSPDLADEAADKAIDFALYCNIGADEKPETNYDSEALALQAAEESIVLLKNEGVLPLGGAEKICVIGQPAFVKNPASGESFADIIAKTSFNLTGAAQGYKLADERDDALLHEAVVLAKNSDTALLFLDTADDSRMKLPANRLALIAALKDAGVKIIAVLTTAQSVDVGFDSGVSALLTAPVYCKRGGEALVNILLGKSPSGRLANTLYADTDSYFEKIKRDKDSGKIRIGSFLGYRYYTTAGLDVKYPFGHGLSYTEFTYSDLSVQGEQVLVTVTNTGKVDGSEVVQLYIGKPDSKIIRPVKELKSYIKVRLRAGEAKTLRFRVSPERLAVYCPETGRKVTEGGSYTVFVGRSVTDICLAGIMQVSGEVLKPDKTRLSDYIPTISNVVEGGYTLAPVQQVLPSGKKQKLAGLILMLISVLGAVIFATLNLVHVMTMDTPGAAPVIVVIVMIFVTAAALLASSFIQMKNAKAHPVAVSTQRPVAVKAEGADSLESLFEQEFSNEEDEQEEVKEVEGDEREILKYLDDGLTFAAAAENLTAYLTERGLSVNIKTARKILSAFASTRLILLKSGNNTLTAEFLRNLCGFFGAQASVEIYEKCENISGFLNLGGVKDTMEFAADNKHCVQPVCVENVEIADIAQFFTPFAKFMKNPEAGASLYLEGGRELKLPQNLWFVFALSENSYLKDADPLIAENACVLDLDISPAKSKDSKTQFNTLSYYQLKSIADAAKKTYSLDEDKCWKKIDKFEKYIASHTPFALSNKAWQKIELFASAYLACGGEEAEALDLVAASKLMIMACANLNGKLKPSESIPSAVENIFGEDGIYEIKKILKYSGKTAARRSGNAGE